MSLSFMKQTIATLRRNYGTRKLILSRYVDTDDTDFKTAEVSTRLESRSVVGIALPKNTNTAFLSKSLVTIDKNSRIFIIETYKCPTDWVKTGQFITYNGVRMNIKESDTVENIYHYVMATSTGVESED